MDAALAAQTSVVAFNAEDPGCVSVSFDIPEVVGTATQTKTIRVVNHGTTAQTYQLAIDTVVNAPGVAFSLPGGTSVTVPPGTDGRCAGAHRRDGGADGSHARCDGQRHAVRRGARPRSRACRSRGIR